MIYQATSPKNNTALQKSSWLFSKDPNRKRNNEQKGGANNQQNLNTYQNYSP
jgi:hypothetical protein